MLVDPQISMFFFCLSVCSAEIVLEHKLKSSISLQLIAGIFSTMFALLFGQYVFFASLSIGYLAWGGHTLLCSSIASFRGFFSKTLCCTLRDRLVCCEAVVQAGFENALDSHNCTISLLSSR